MLEKNNECLIKVKDGQYGTHDLYLAAFLKVVGVVHVTTERQGYKAVFIFEGKLEALKLQVDSYYKDTLKVKPHEFSTAIRYFKSIIHRI